VINFETPAQQACYERITPWIHELFPETVVTVDYSPMFGISLGSAVAQTEVLPWGEDEAIVLTRSYVVTQIEITSDLLYYLLRENDSLYFGRFALDSEDDIVFEHSLVGSTCDLAELRTAVITVVKFADEYDDKIVSRWGGQRAIDRWAQVIQGD